MKKILFAVVFLAMTIPLLSIAGPGTRDAAIAIPLSELMKPSGSDGSKAWHQIVHSFFTDQHTPGDLSVSWAGEFGSFK